MSEDTNNSSIQLALQIITTLNSIPPHTSLSFVLDQSGLDALQEIAEIVEEKFPKNMTNMRAAAIETLAPLTEGHPNVPLNVNLTEEDIKALQKIQEILERDLD